MPGVGRNVLSVVIGRFLSALANLDHAEWKAGGVTVDWSTVTAVSGSDVTLQDGTVVAVGQKGLRYGQPLCEITASGKYGPYDVAADDGRQTLTRGKCFILNQTVLQNGSLPGLPAGDTDHPPGVFYKGLVWKDRIIAGSNDHELGAAGPSFAALEAVVDLNYV